jgi:hypothetical protein
VHKRDRLLIACTAAIVVTITLSTAVLLREIRAIPSPPDPGDLQRIVQINASIEAQLECINYRLMSTAEKFTYMQGHPGETC